MIVIVDYGMGNLRSVQKGFARAGFEPLIGFTARDAEFVAVFENRFQPFAFAAGNRLRFGDSAWLDKRQAGKTAAQVFAGGGLAGPRLGQLRFGLRQRAFGLDGFEAGGVAELLAALDGLGLSFEQR